jgi:hypothetical protein
MPRKRSSKIQDINQIAAEILEEAIGVPAPITPVGKKNPAAAESGRIRDLNADAVRTKPGKTEGLPSSKQKA